MTVDPWSVPLPAHLATVDGAPSDDDLNALMDELDVLAGFASKPLNAELVAVYLAGDNLATGDEWGNARRQAIPEVARRFQPDDDGAAEWVARRGAEAQAVLTAAAEQASEWRRKIDMWEKDSHQREKGTVAWAEALLTDYGRRRRDESDGRVKTVMLPSAVIRTSESKAKVAVLDGKAEEYVGWAQVNAPGTLKRSPQVSRFAGVIEVRELLDGWDMDAVLSCGHTSVWTQSVPEDWDGSAPEIPEDDTAPCFTCDPDPIEGTPPIRQIVEATITPVSRLAAVFAADGSEVPGLTVEPAHVNSKATFA